MGGVKPTLALSIRPGTVSPLAGPTSPICPKGRFDKPDKLKRPGVGDHCERLVEADSAEMRLSARMDVRREMAAEQQ